MSPEEEAPPEEFKAQISAPVLLRFTFVRRDADPTNTSEDQPQLTFELGLIRLARERLVADLSLVMRELSTAEISIAYRMAIELHFGDKSDEEFERELRPAMAYLVPQTIYPFMRETIVSTALKAGLPPVLAPIVNFRDVFDPETIAIPPLPQASEVESEPDPQG